jgi:hypothetical protein
MQTNGGGGNDEGNRIFFGDCHVKDKARQTFVLDRHPKPRRSVDGTYIHSLGIKLIVT